VDEPTIEFFFEVAPKKSELIAFVDAFSYLASLDRTATLHRLVRTLNDSLS